MRLWRALRSLALVLGLGYAKVVYLRRRAYVAPSDSAFGVHEYHDEKLFVGRRPHRHLLDAPFGTGAHADTIQDAHAHVQADGVSASDAGFAAETAADQSDIYYEKLIVFKKSHTSSADAVDMAAAQLQHHGRVQASDANERAEQRQTLQ
ncbi:hypothetical protein SPRG_01479 [Saprolegnia parasitica CBS 223.65]|uniref:Uncharacterized protein n=1 Tax=Saprolegnia parasitica (strain CBS 223.65) TaxID=695850 RepID=A0A067CV11_SAPPC|nr:hypothetical protein SPRG_01479 [Saprolegnia parasitica CBS 223.65]KDO34343.1 hypothetical protein SPRG_01479 [Saprolegnia parasitica CBS 223.65]|eukprot:XP_012195079.1 hypothetical protein SPRG_01479 [Saprolegnia parasitica CBS 223.65]